MSFRDFDGTTANAVLVLAEQIAVNPEAIEWVLLRLAVRTLEASPDHASHLRSMLRGFLANRRAFLMTGDITAAAIALDYWERFNFTESQWRYPCTSQEVGTMGGGPRGAGTARAPASF